MIQLHTLNTMAGNLKLLSLEDFIKEIPIEIISGGECVRIPILESTTYGTLFAIDEIYPNVPSSTINHHEVKLKTTYISALDLKQSKENYLKILFNHQIIAEFQIEVCKTKPVLFCKDLNLKEIEEVSCICCENNSNVDCIIHFTLNEDQKFLIIGNPKGFKFFKEEGFLRMLDRDAVTIRGALFNACKNDFYVIRYKNSKWLNEIAEQRRYEGSLMYNPLSVRSNTVIKNFGI